MAGLALGSFLLGRFIDKRQDALRIYAVLEFLVAIAALLVPVLFSLSVPLYQYVYQVSGENLTVLTVVRAAVSFLSVLIPTTIMGGTLPVLTSFLVKKDSLFGKNFSILYGLNTFGAVVGVLLSGFVTIGSLGEQKHRVYRCGDQYARCGDSVRCVSEGSRRGGDASRIPGDKRGKAQAYFTLQRGYQNPGSGCLCYRRFYLPGV